MYNLATVIEENPILSNGLNNNDLKKNMEQLEKEYLDSSKQNVSLLYIV